MNNIVYIREKLSAPSATKPGTENGHYRSCPIVLDESGEQNLVQALADHDWMRPNAAGQHYEASVSA